MSFFYPLFTLTLSDYAYCVTSLTSMTVSFFLRCWKHKLLGLNMAQEQAFMEKNYPVVDLPCCKCVVAVLVLPIGV